jgi:hypothetical protein
MFDSLPAALLTLFLAACVLWLVWKVFRRLLSPRKRRPESSLVDTPDNGRIEPAIRPTTATVSTIPDAADVLALKAAIDNLARQVAALERRLAAGQASPPPQPLASSGTVEQSSVLPSVTPHHRI